jgi:tRNA A37 N6-isopentenylltransferase MiaA
MRKKGRTKKTGAARMQEFGYKQVQLWLDASELALVSEAAAKEGRKLATWIRQKAVLAAGGERPRA